MPIQAPKPAAEQPSNPYQPPGMDTLVFEQFQGINTSTSRAGVKDEEMWWCDGFIIIGPRLLRTIPDKGPALWTVSQSSEPVGTLIFFMGFVNISTTPYCLAFLTNGSIYAINTSTGVANRIAPAGTIGLISANAVGFAQVGSSYVIIVNASTNSYFIWDGTTFFFPGDSFLSGTVPTGISGNTVEIYAGRVWVGSAATIFFSAPGSLIDFTTGNGGGAITSGDSFLRVNFVQFRQSNGFLYLVADSSINYISGVQTGGSPLVTTFTNQNADPEVGSPYPWTVTTFGRNIMLANSFGAHVSYGAAVTKISTPLDGVYGKTVTGMIPSAGKAVIFGKKFWVLLYQIVDPVTGQVVNKMFLWNEQRQWVATEQSAGIGFISYQEILSDLTTWGTDSRTIWPLFQDSSATLTKTVQSRLWDRPGGYEFSKAAGRLWALGQFYETSSEEIIVRLDNESNNAGEAEYVITPTLGAMTWTGLGGNPLTWTGLGGNPLTWLSSSGAISPFLPQAVAQNGVLLGFTLQTNQPDFGLVSLKMAPINVGYRG